MHAKIYKQRSVQLINIYKRVDSLSSSQSYKSLRFIDPNPDTNIVHKSPMRVNEIHSPVLFQFESTKGLGNTYEYSTSLTHSSQPQVKLPIFQQKTANEIHEIQHTLTLPLDSRLNPGTLTGNSEILKVSLLIFMNGQNHFQLQHSAGILDS